MADSGALLEHIASLPDPGPFFREYVWRNPLVRWIVSFFGVLYTFLFVRPLALIYLKGPNFMGYGMWGGLDAADICYELTGVSARQWDGREDACLSIIQRKFDAFLIAVATVLVVVATYRALSWLWFVWFVHPANVDREVRLLRAQQEVLMACVRRETAQQRQRESGVVQPRPHQKITGAFSRGANIGATADGSHDS